VTMTRTSSRCRPALFPRSRHARFSSVGSTRHSKGVRLSASSRRSSERTYVRARNSSERTARAISHNLASGASKMTNWSNWDRCPPGDALRAGDPEIADLIEKEIQRQNEGLELIASENFVSPAVLEAMGSPLTN